MKTLCPRFFSLFVISLLAIGAGLIVSSIGCGKLDTGAYAEPSVRVKAAESLLGELKKGDGDKINPAADTGAPGTLVGRVVFKSSAGKMPAQVVVIQKGTAIKNPEICAATMDIFNEELLVSDDGGIANVFVYLEKPPAGFKTEVPSEVIPFDQKGCVFTTHAMVCQVGQTIKVLNDDATIHNTRTVPQKNTGDNFNVSPKERVGLTLIYKKPESIPVPVRCDIHAWMGAYHLPLNHPFGVVSGKDGRFKIENLPAGNHEFKVWHEKAEFLNRKLKVSIKGGETTEVAITAEAVKFGL
jgi:plastocyanin